MNADLTRLMRVITLVLRHSTKEWQLELHIDNPDSWSVSVTDVAHYREYGWGALHAGTTHAGGYRIRK